MIDPGALLVNTSVHSVAVVLLPMPHWFVVCSGFCYPGSRSSFRWCVRRGLACRCPGRTVGLGLAVPRLVFPLSSLFGDGLSPPASLIPLSSLFGDGLSPLSFPSALFCMSPTGWTRFSSAFFWASPAGWTRNAGCEARWYSTD